MMLIIVWVFIGIEGVSIYLWCVGKCVDVGCVIVIGFLCVLVLLMLVNLLLMGVFGYEKLVYLYNFLMVFVLEVIVGLWGVILIIIGMIVLVLGVLLVWVLLCVEVLYVVVGDGMMLVFLVC